MHDGQRGAFCGKGDQTLRTVLPHCRPGWSPADTVVAPFASGALDVRSRALASRFAVGDHVWTHLHHRDVEGDCDGLQGYFLALCLDSAPVEVTALHLPDLKFHAPPASAHSTVLHPFKSRRAHGVDGGGWLAAQPALLPLVFTLQPCSGAPGTGGMPGGQRGMPGRPGGQHLSWRPDNLSVVDNFLRHRGAAHSLCQHVPCG